MRKLILLFFPLLSAFSLMAQEAGVGDSPFSLGIHGGTQGFGVNAAYPVSAQFALRVSASYAPYGYTAVRSWNNNDYDLEMKSKFGNVLLQAEYRPFNNGTAGKFAQKLAITAGAAVFYQAEATAKGVPTDDYAFGDLIIDREDIGTINVTSQWKKVAPYAGLALREMRLGSRLSLNLDLGSHYLSSPKVTLTGDKLLANNEANEATLQRNLKNYRWLPVLQLGLSYHF